MNYIVLYGPPAVGKLTLARQLALLTDFKLVHNHLLFDLVNSLYKRPSAKLDTLIEDLHIAILKNAHENGIAGIITTMCGADPRDTPLFTRINLELSEIDLTITFVQLKCEADEIKKRVISPEREAWNKLNSPDPIDSILSENDYYTAHVGSDTLSLDTTTVDPECNCQSILRFLNSRKHI